MTKTYAKHIMFTLAIAFVIVGSVFIAQQRMHTASAVVPSSVVQHDEHMRTTVVPQPCEEEDASGPNDDVCRWDADTAGLANGGLSFTAFHPDKCTVVFLYDNGEVVRWDDQC
jgi:hypothetical protein